MISRKTESDSTRLPENNAPMITAQSTNVLSSRRRKIFAFEGWDLAAGITDIRDKLTTGGKIANFHFRGAMPGLTRSRHRPLAFPFQTARITDHSSDQAVVVRMVARSQARLQP